MVDIDPLALGPPSSVMSDRTGGDPRTGGAKVALPSLVPKASVTFLRLSTVHGQSASAAGFPNSVHVDPTRGPFLHRHEQLVLLEPSP